MMSDNDQIHRLLAARVIGLPQGAVPRHPMRESLAGLLCEPLVEVTKRAVILQRAYLETGEPATQIAGILEEIAANQTDPIGEGCALFLARQAQRHKWGFVPFSGFVSDSSVDE